MSGTAAPWPALPPVEREREVPDTNEVDARWWTSPGSGVLYATCFAVLMAQTWFRPGRFIASGDSGPMLRGLEGVTRSWTDTLAGTGSTGYRAAALPDGAVYELVTAIGLSPTFAQRVWYTLVVGLCAAAVSWLAAAVCRHAASTTAAGVFAVIAPFHLTTLPNLLPMICIAAIAGVLGWAVRAVLGRPPHPAWAVLLAVALGPVSRNPPLLVIVVATIATAVVVVLLVGRCARRIPVLALCWLGGASLAWFVPLVVHYLSGTPGLEIVAQTDVGAWDWTQRNSGPANVVRLVASWVWGDPDVIGSVARLDAGVWPLLAWALPVAVLASALVARRRQLAVSLLAVAAVLVVLCVGVNPPFGSVNRFLYDHVPGFWLFRQPMSKFGVPLVVVYGLLLGLGADGLMTRIPQWRSAAARAATGVATVLVLAIVAFSHPMWTGSVIHGQRGGANQLPPGRVALPAAWYEAGQWLDDAPANGAVAVLPLSDYYQQGTQWGFYGVNDLVARLTDRPAINLLPGGYYEPAGAVPDLVRALQTSIARDDGVGARRLMGALGVSYVAIRRDLTTVPVRPSVDGMELAEAAGSLTELRLVAEFDPVVIFEASEPLPQGALRAVDVDADLDPARLADLVATAPDDSTFVEQANASGHADAWLPSGGVTSHEVRTGRGSYHVSTRTIGELLWEASVVDRPGGRRELEVRLRSTIRLGGVDLHPPTTVTLPATEDTVGIVVDDRPIVLGEEPILFGAAAGSSVRALAGGESLRVDGPGSGALGNCNNRSGQSLSESGISAEPIDHGVHLSAASGSACLAVPVPEAPSVLGSRMWHVTGEFTRTSGPATRVCLWIPASERCAEGSPRALADESGTFDFVAASYAGEELADASLVLYSDSGGDDPGATDFTDVAVDPVSLAPGSVDLPEVSAPQRTEEFPDQGVARFTIDPELAVNLLQSFPTEVEDCNNYDDAGAESTRLSARRIGDGPDAVLELSAARHSACVSAAVRAPAGVRDLTVEFEYRSDDSAARWCLRGEGASCTAGGALPATDGWNPVRVDVDVPQHRPLATPEEYQLYVYAVGAGPEEPAGDVRVVQYRRASVRPTFPMAAVIHPSAEVSGERHMVVERTAFAAGWAARFPGGSSLTGHEVVDGWANGWTAPDGARGELQADFAPDRLVSGSVWLLPFVLLAAGVALLRDRVAGWQGSAGRRRSSS